MKFLPFLIGLLLLSTNTNLQAQSTAKLTNSKNKINSFILNGYYYKAEKENNDYITELENNNSNKQLIYAYLNEAKISLFLGTNIKQWEQIIAKAEVTVTEFGSREHHLFFYSTVAELYNSYGDYNKSKKAIDKSKQYSFPKTSVNENYIPTIAEANLNIQQGNFNIAIQLLDEYSTRYKKRIRTTFVEVKRGKEVTRKASSKYLDKQFSEYVFLLNLKTKALLSSGNFEAATTLLNSTNIYIQENINKRDISYIDNKILEGEIALAREDYPKASRIFDKVYDKYIHRSNHGISYKPTSSKYLNFIALTATAHWLNESNSGAQEVYNHIEPQIKRYYKEATPQRSWINALKGQKYYHKGNYVKAIAIFENVLADTSTLPLNHPYRLNISKFLLKSYIGQREYKKPVALITDIDRLNKMMNLVSSPTYYTYKLEEAIYITEYSNDINKATVAFTVGLTTAKAGGLFTQSPNYIKYKNDKALYLVEFNKLSDALLLIKATTDSVLATYGEAHFRYGNQLERLANLLLISGDYSLAYKTAEKSKNILHEYSRRKLNQSQSLRTFANTCIVRGQFRDAEKALKRAQTLSNSTDLSLDIDEFSRLYIDNGEYTRVEEILLTSLQNKIAFFGADNKRILTQLKQLSELYLILGDYPQASVYNDRSIKLSETIFGVKSLQYSSCLKQKANINSAIGDYQTAIRDYKIVLELEKTSFGPNTIIPAETGMLIAINKYYNGDKSPEIEKTLIRSVETIESRFEQKDNPLVANALTLLAIYQIENNKLSLADNNLIRANDIWKERTNLKKGNKHTAKILSLRAAIHAYQLDYPKALTLYTESTEMYKKVFSNSHPDYVHTYSKLGQMYYISGDEKKALVITEKSAALNMMLVKNVFPSLSERGKSQFWATHQSDFEFYYTLAFKYHEKKPKLAANVYNFILSTKYLLLNSSLKIRQSILDSGNEEMIAKFRLYQTKREDLYKTLTAGQNIVTSNTENRNKLEKDIEELEKELSTQSDLFNSTLLEKDITWKDIKNKLAPNENAVEIIRYRYFDKTFSDSIIYVALIINDETTKAPKVVVLPNGNKMENGYLKHYRNSVKYRIKDTKSYANYWGPISNKIKPNSTVYLSAEGAYTQINMETFTTPSNNFLIQEYDLVLLTNTKDLLKNSKKTIVQGVPAFFANPSYYQINNTSKEHKNIGAHQSVAQLPGAEHEITSIKEILEEKKISYDAFIYDKATEQAIKELKSPQFLHLATHGYFIKDVDVSYNKIENNRTIANSLLKSGILLANAGDIVDNEQFYNYNKNDGVLTSLEAMNLNLDNTDFVILSACETGLGEIKNGEGVYGLQRALQLAGAQTIFMSLFKVDDEVTDKLMSIYYKKYYELNDKRKAFVEAKKQLMKEYNSPYFWGSFVMIE